MAEQSEKIKQKFDALKKQETELQGNWFKVQNEIEETKWKHKELLEIQNELTQVQISNKYLRQTLADSQQKLKTLIKDLDFELNSFAEKKNKINQEAKNQIQKSDPHSLNELENLNKRQEQLLKQLSIRSEEVLRLKNEILACEQAISEDQNIMRKNLNLEKYTTQFNQMKERFCETQQSLKENSRLYQQLDKDSQEILSQGEEYIKIRKLKDSEECLLTKLNSLQQEEISLENTFQDTKTQQHDQISSFRTKMESEISQGQQNIASLEKDKEILKGKNQKMFVFVLVLLSAISLLVLDMILRGIRWIQ